MSLLVLTLSDVGLLTSSLSPSHFIHLSASTFSQFSNGTSVNPARLSIPAPSHTTLIMPARSSDTTALKLASVPTSTNDTRGIPASTVVIDENSGAVKAIVNSKSLTAIRTAAGSLLASHLLAPESPRTILVFGAGAQAHVHLSLHLTHYPSLTTALIINRTLNERTKSLTTTLRTQFPKVTILCTDISFAAFSHPRFKLNALREWVSSADIIITTTPSTTPLFPASYMKPGTHINMVGSWRKEMKEVGEDVLRRAGVVVVDSKEACRREAGEFGDHWVGMMEIGEMVGVDDEAQIKPLAQVVQSVKQQGDITIFKSVGLAVQDAAIAGEIVKRAEELGVGVRVDGYDG